MSEEEKRRRDICESCGWTNDFCICKDCKGMDLTKKLKNCCLCGWDALDCESYTPKQKWEGGISPLQALCNICGKDDCDCKLCRGKEGEKYGCGVEKEGCLFNEEFSFCPLFTSKETKEG